jgi:hypothetical protein
MMYKEKAVGLHIMGGGLCHFGSRLLAKYLQEFWGRGRGRGRRGESASKMDGQNSILYRKVLCSFLHRNRGKESMFEIF